MDACSARCPRSCGPTATRSSSITGRDADEALDLVRDRVAAGVDGAGRRAAATGWSTSPCRPSPAPAYPLGHRPGRHRQRRRPRTRPARSTTRRPRCDGRGGGPDPRTSTWAGSAAGSSPVCWRSGFDAMVNERANRMTWPKGQMRYNIAIAGRAAHLPAGAVRPRARRRAPGRLEAMLVAVGNGPSYGGGMRICRGRAARRRAARRHRARPDVASRSSCGSSRRVFKGTHVAHPAVRCTGPARSASPSPGVDGLRRRRAARARCRCTARPCPAALHGLAPPRRLTAYGIARAAVRRRAAPRSGDGGPGCERFAALYPFGLDPFQVRACEALEDGQRRARRGADRRGQDRRRRVRRAPRARRAAASASTRRRSRRCRTRSSPTWSRATAPTGSGLLTGDNTVNGEAPIVVMTTEVLRNMLYAGSRHARAASATSSWTRCTTSPTGSAARSGRRSSSTCPSRCRWSRCRRRCATPRSSATGSRPCAATPTSIVEEHRPVPLWQHVMVGQPAVRPVRRRRQATTRQVNPELVRVARDAGRAQRSRDRPRRPQRGGQRPRRLRGRPQPGRGRRPARRRGAAAGDHLHLQPGRLRRRRPAVPARRPAADRRRRSATRSARIVEERCADIPDEDLARARLPRVARRPGARRRGAPRRHAADVQGGRRGAVRRGAWSRSSSPPRRWRSASTCRPARSCSRSWSKWNGETHADVTPGEYTQLTGRAGRRGIDVEGHAVVLWQPGLDPRRVAGLASTRTYPLRSRFRPSYNMAVNLVAPVRPATGRASCWSRRSRSSRPTGPSSAWPGRCASSEEALEGYREAMTCHLGDFAEYAGAAARRSSDREAALSRSGAANRRAAGRRVAGGAAARRRDRGAGGPPRRARGRPRPGHGGRRATGRGRRCSPPTGRYAGCRWSTSRRRSSRWTGCGSPRPSTRATRRSRRDLAVDAAQRRPRRSAGGGAPVGPRSVAADDEDLLRLRAELRAHPCHGCAEREDHARWAERYLRLRPGDRAPAPAGRASAPTRSRAPSTGSATLLEELGYLARRRGDAGRPRAGAALHRARPAGRRVPARRRVGRAGTGRARRGRLGARLRVAPGRRPRPRRSCRPGARREVLDETRRHWGALEERERDHRLAPARSPTSASPGRPTAGRRARRWTRCCARPTWRAGDFVRWTKQVIDLLGQVADAARLQPGGEPVGAAARKAADLLRRGVVAYSSVA